MKRADISDRKVAKQVFWHRGWGGGVNKVRLGNLKHIETVGEKGGFWGCRILEDESLCEKEISVRVLYRSKDEDI